MYQLLGGSGELRYDGQLEEDHDGSGPVQIYQGVVDGNSIAKGGNGLFGTCLSLGECSAITINSSVLTQLMTARRQESSIAINVKAADPSRVTT